MCQFCQVACYQVPAAKCLLLPRCPLPIVCCQVPVPSVQDWSCSFSLPARLLRKILVNIHFLRFSNSSFSELETFSSNSNPFLPNNSFPYPIDIFGFLDILNLKQTPTPVSSGPMANSPQQQPVTTAAAKIHASATTAATSTTAAAATATATNTYNSSKWPAHTFHQIIWQARACGCLVNAESDQLGLGWSSMPRHPNFQSQCEGQGQCYNMLSH